jgi:uncharacterized membrane protein YqjE
MDSRVIFASTYSVELKVLFMLTFLVLLLIDCMWSTRRSFSNQYLLGSTQQNAVYMKLGV